MTAGELEKQATNMADEKRLKIVTEILAKQIADIRAAEHNVCIMKEHYEELKAKPLDEVIRLFNDAYGRMK